MSRIKEIEAMSKAYSAENGKRKGSLAEELAFVAGALWADKTIIEKVTTYANERYDLDYCGDVKDILNYLKSLVED